MIALSGLLLYLLLCGWMATLAARRFRAERCLVTAAVFSGAFILPFHVLGVFELSTGVRAATTANAALLLVAGALALRLVPHARVSIPASFERHGWVPSLTLAVFALGALLLAFGRPQGYEVMAYHLPLSVNLLQTHSLMAWDGNFPHTFPANASVLWAVLLEALPERLVSAANLVLLVPLVLAVHALCRLAEADRKASWYACCGMLGVPMIAFSSAELGADIGGIAFATLAMAFVLSPLRPAVAMTLAGLCMGLAIGFKSLHLITAVAVGLVACARDGAPRAGGLDRGLQVHGLQAHDMQARLWNAALFGGVALLAGGFWMLRNAVMLGNPLHPVGVPLVGAWFGWLPSADFDTSLRRTTELEWVDHAWQWLFYPWMESQRYGQNFKHSSGLGAFIAAAIPGTAMALGAAVIRDGLKAHRVRAALLSAVLFIVAAWWLLGDRQPRYVLAALPLAMPLLAWAVTQAAGGWRRVFDMGLAVCIVAMLGVFLSRQALQFGDRILLSRQTSRAAFYEYPAMVDNLPAGAAILNLADRSWHYPLAGAALSNRVISMPEGRRMLALPPSLTAPREVRLRAASLRAAGVTHVFAAGARLTHDACVQLEEAARLDRNPVNGEPLGSARVLYAVRYLCR
ncbi:hypothetical protein GJV26_12245 [Massilia dura]|uniref:Glycosyltransferase RgtA/B/C/D-like domain-containing protein n=1 Tax=Pseudoduganella dura TaxID=321982 RepID=A0A6I3X8T2_9BURK|nr:hypothetical protein [Pseudoduganella dura]MUI13224.1 hypothetical protein [Pseudoduganella dura]GGX90849.1 hypothetical protein GCM10007386_22120 [Pseudoduganella dura]